MREPLRVDEAYYINHNTDYSKFADAVMDVGPAPCTFHNCPKINECKTEEKECFAFRIWVNKGENYLTERNKKGVIKCIEKMGTRFESLK